MDYYQRRFWVGERNKSWKKPNQNKTKQKTKKKTQQKKKKKKNKTIKSEQLHNKRRDVIGWQSMVFFLPFVDDFDWIFD